MLVFFGHVVSAHSQAFGIAPLQSRSADGLRGILEWGSRTWELTHSRTLIIRHPNADGQPEFDACFVLEAADLQPDTVRLPQTVREMAFVAALQLILTRDGPAAWPVLVFSAPDRRHGTPDVSLATTRRIILRDEKGVFRPAAAIVLNSIYWGAVDPPPSWADRGLAAVVAQHELYHVRRSWLRAQETNAHADSIEARMRGSGVPLADREELELMVSESIAAREEIEAIDQSLGSAVLLAAHRRGILQYREDNRLRVAKTVKSLLALFGPMRDPSARQELHRWLTDLLHKDLCAPALTSGRTESSW